MKVLHILRKSQDDLARETIERQPDNVEVTVVLIQEAVSLRERLTKRLLVLEDDVRDMHVDMDIPRISYHDLLNLIFEHDKVFCW